MKKILCVAIAIVLAVAVFAVPVSAATPREKVASAVKAAIPKAYNDLFVASVDNILNQVEVTEDQAAQVIAIIDETKAKLPDRGHSLHQYSDEEIAYATEQFGKACAVLNITYKIVAKKGAIHVGDIVCELYYNNTLIGVLDGDIGVKKTGADMSNTVSALAIAGGAVLMAAAALFVFKKSATVEA